MTFCKLVAGNVRRHLRDYGVYFLTLTLAVALFYAFNAVGEQQAFLELSMTKALLFEQMTALIRVLSVLIALVLGFLVLYANQFLLRRRQKEFGLCLLLGMGKGRLALLFTAETLLVGALAFVAGLALGLGLAQVLALASIRLFAVNLSRFRAIFSPGSLALTARCFGLIYLVTLAANLTSLTRLRLAELLAAARRNEPVRRQPPLRTALLGLLGLGCAAAGLALFWRRGILPSRTDAHFQWGVGLLAAGTVALFAAGAGALVQGLARRPFYRRGLNSFVVRQVAARLRGNCLTLSVVCALLTVVLVMATVGPSTALAMNRLSDQSTPYDLNVQSTLDPQIDLAAYLTEQGFPVADYCERYAQITVRAADKLTYGDLFAGQRVDLWPVDAEMDLLNTPVTVVSVSDYNTAMAIQGRPAVTLGADQYLLSGNYEGTLAYLRAALRADPVLTIAGTELHSASDAPLGITWYMTQIGNNDRGSLIVPDAVAERLTGSCITVLLAQYRPDTDPDAALGALAPLGADLDSGLRYAERRMMEDAYFGSNAMVVMLCCYLGVLFLLICAALLAIKQLTDMADGLPRYRLLQKLGADPRAVGRALWQQIALYFGAPLALALVYTLVLGTQAARTVERSMNLHLTADLWLAFVLLGLVYGGYFLATWSACRRMVREPDRPRP